MAEFTPKKVTANDFNNGVKYRDFDSITGYEGDTPRAADFNNVIENQLYVQNLVSGASDTVESGDTNLVTGGAVYSAIDKVDMGKYEQLRPDLEITLKPNVFYSLNRVTILTIKFETPTADRINEYKGRIETYGVANISFPSSIRWIGGYPTFEEIAIYEFSVIDNIGVIVRV